MQQKYLYGIIITAILSLSIVFGGALFNSQQDTQFGAYSPSGSVISSGNSSTALLTNGSTFTGTWEDVGSYDSLVVAVKTDQNGYFTVQFSPDGTNQDSTLTRYYRTSQIEAPHRFTITRQYARVTFTNDSGSDQTYLRLQTTYGSKGDLNAPIDSTLAQDFDSITTRPTDYTTEVALGRRQGATTWNKFGYNEDVDTATDPEILASWGGTFGYLTTGETINFESSSANDTLGGTGVRQVIIYGIDENWDSVLEVLNMEGTTATTTTNSYIGVNRVAIYTSGSSNSNAGTISASSTSSGVVMAEMPTGQGTTQQCIYFVPRDHQFLATWLRFNSIKLAGGGGSPEVQLKGFVYSNVVDSEFEVYRDVLDTANENSLDIHPSEPFLIGEKSILWFTAETDKDNTAVRCRFSGKLIRDVDAN